jgi:hypothetical protein
MKAWDHLTNIAMLGTDKSIPRNNDLPEEIAVITDAIEASETLDKEAKYLQTAALVYNYRQCGFSPLKKPDIQPAKAEAETLHHCSSAAAGILNEILEEGNEILLELWLSACSKNGQLLKPFVLPTLLDKARTSPRLQSLIIACSGYRGLWLSRGNPDWNFFTVLPDEEVWHNGTQPQRVELLTKIRQTEPAEALELLQETWSQENAANKLELLKVLKINRGAADLPFLEGLLSEKGQKVKEEALNLLKQIPGSAIVNQYEDLLRQSVTLKKEKAMLGMMTKISIRQKLPEVVDESIFKSGIERLSGPAQKNITDESFIIYQLAGFVPPSFWVKQFDAAPAQVFEYFEKYAADLIGALGLAVTRFSENEWMTYFLHQENKFFSDFLDELPLAERDDYLLRLFKQAAESVIHSALQCKREWGNTLALTLLREMANNPYQYNRATYSQHIDLMPVSLLTQLEKIEAKEPNLQATWQKQRQHLTRLLNLKKQTLTAFNA